LSPLPRSKDDWSPYKDRVAFETAERLFAKEQLSAAGIDALMDLWRASFIQRGIIDGGAPFVNHNDLYNTIDSTPLGDVPWQLFSISYDGQLPEANIPTWMTDKFDVWFRDPHLIATNILGNPDFASEFDSVPFRRFDTNGNQIWDDFMSGSWAWMQAVRCLTSSLSCLRELIMIPQDKIAKDPATHGSMFVPIILGSDKTTVSVATGQNEYYPLYMSIGNVHNGVRRAHRNALALVAFLAMPKSTSHLFL
jgi:hypothetical protein